MDIKRQYDNIGKQYIEGQNSFFSKREDWCRIATAKHLGDVSGKKILDIGCGGGVDFKIFSSQQADVYGIDPSQVMVEEAKKTVQHPENIYLGEYEHIPFPDQTFDIVFGRFSLHYLKSFGMAYQEIHRVLKPASLLLQIVSHPVFDLLYRLEPGHEESNLVTVHLYGNGTRVTFPAHVLSDYFSNDFFKLFTLASLEEYSEEEVENKKMQVPGALLFLAHKK